MEIKKISNQKGSLLLEILLAVAIAAIIIGGVSSLIMVSLKSGQVSGEKSAAMGLAEEGLEAMKAIGENDWHNIYLPPAGKGESEENTYYVHKKNDSGTFSWEITKNIVDGNITVNGVAYTRKVYIFNVTRNKNNDRKICVVPADCPDGEAEDPSTQRVKVKVSQSGGADVIAEEYLVRWKNNIFVQTDWSQSSPSTEADCQSAGGVWDASNSICYARNNYPDTQSGCEAAGGVWNSENLTCSINNENNWKAYGTKDTVIDNAGGILKLKP